MREVLGSIRIEHLLEVAICRSRAYHRCRHSFRDEVVAVEIFLSKGNTIPYIR